MGRKMDAVPSILLVDDEVEGTELKTLLELYCYQVVELDNGLDAAASARHTRPDLILVDLNVPLFFERIAARQIVKRRTSAACRSCW